MIPRFLDPSIPPNDSKLNENLYKTAFFQNKVPLFTSLTIFKFHYLVGNLLHKKALQAKRPLLDLTLLTGYTVLSIYIYYRL